MKTIKVLSLVFVSLVLFSSCDIFGPSKVLTSADSLKIAESYYKSNPTKSKVFLKTTPTDIVKGITLEEATTYNDLYKKEPAFFTDKNEAINGFMFKGDELMKFTRNPQLRGIFVTFGKTQDGAVSLMMQGTDSSNTIIPKTYCLFGPPICPPNTNCPIAPKITN